MAQRDASATVTVDGAPETFAMAEGETRSFSAVDDAQRSRWPTAGRVAGDLNGRDLGAPGEPGQSVDGDLRRTTRERALAGSRERRDRRGGVGTELLLGQIANTNARWMSEASPRSGSTCSTTGGRRQHGPDRGGARLAASRADVVLVTGGLGPTEDDITRDAIARGDGRRDGPAPRARDDAPREVRRATGGRCRRATCGRPTCPRAPGTSCPERGTAPGLVVELSGGGRLYAMAGVPGRDGEMMAGTVLPELAARAGPAVVRSRRRSAAPASGSRASPRASTTCSRRRRTRRVAYLASGGRGEGPPDGEGGHRGGGRRAHRPLPTRSAPRWATSCSRRRTSARGGGEPAARGRAVARSPARSRSPAGRRGRG